jgi:type II secretory pathway pseudopilin PulG
MTRRARILRGPIRRRLLIIRAVSQRRGQSGYALIDMIITIAVSAIVMGAIFPIFLVLYRTETIFTEDTQARAMGLAGEDSLLRDVRAYDLVSIGNNSLVLRGVGSKDESNFTVNYSIDSTSTSAPTLVRTVLDQNGNTIKRAFVAHGIQSFTVSCSGSTPLLHVALWVETQEADSLRLQPDLMLSPRNPQGCP